MFIKIEIKSCKECKHFSTTTCQTNDSWERPDDWWCGAKEEKVKIQGYVEWNDEKHIKVPEWCPLKAE